MVCSETERTSALLDGELDGAAIAAAEGHIATCPDCQALVAAGADLSEALRAPSARLKAPPLLKARIGKALDAEARRTGRPAFLWGALSGVGVSGMAAVLALVIMAPPQPQAFTVALADAHVQALERGQTIAVVSSSHHTVKPWFAGRAPLSPPVGDFAAQGFPLLGGRIDTVLGRRAAVVVYGHGAHEIDLYVWKTEHAHPLAAAAEVAGYREVLWTQGDLSLAAVSDVGSAELRQFVALVQGLRE
jgi:anti-sigma factor RsiW